jgi:hypothetical protein
MLRRTRFHLAIAAVLAIVGGASCRSDYAAAPQPAERSALHGLNDTKTSLITCPAAETDAVYTSTIGPLGGVLAAGNMLVVIPADAVPSDTKFTLTIPASKYVEMQVTTDVSEHFEFKLPVTVTLDYGRCGRSNLDKGPLSAWYIDWTTKELLYPMVSVDDKLARTITFSTMHFSGYAVAD